MLPYWLDLNEDRPNRHGSPILRSEPFEDDPRIRFYAVGGLHYIRGNARPYFSLTADYPDGGGCCHEEILKRFPDLKPLAALHMADDKGRPMYAHQNGFYWLAGYAGGIGEQYHGGNSTPAKTADDCLAIWARHVRLPIGLARVEVDRLISLGRDVARTAEYRLAGDVVHALKAEGKAIRKLHAAWVEAQAIRWENEARACIAALGIRFYYGDRFGEEQAPAA